MNVSLPIPLKTWVERQVKEKGYSTASEYVRDILRREQEHQQEVQERVDERLAQALKSGESTPMTQADWNRIRSKGLKLLRARGRSRK